jgi:hypothetical protein
MTNAQILQDRAVELITELLEEAKLCDNDYCITRAQLRYDLAIGWQQHIADISVLFRELYFKTIVIKLDELTNNSSFDPWHTGAVPTAESLLLDFPAIRDITDNSFIAPVILFSANLLNWQLIASKCIDLFFDSALLGPFNTTEAAVDYFRNSLDGAIQMADTGDDDSSCFDEE